MGIVSRWQLHQMGGRFILVGLWRILFSMVKPIAIRLYQPLILKHFSDTYLPLAAQDGSLTYTFAESGIAWPGEAKKYASTPGYTLDQIVPPPNWSKQFPNGYSNSSPPVDLHKNEHFQNWMRTSGLPTFTKLWGRNDGDTLKKGTYFITINLSMNIFMTRRCFTDFL